MIVVAISGHSGAGKSTVIKELSAMPWCCGTLFFDQYEPQLVGHSSIRAWIDELESPDWWTAPGLREEILIRITSYQESQQAALIVEEPFGRSRAEVRDLVDFSLHLDVPISVAMLRKILRVMGSTTYVGRRKLEYIGGVVDRCIRESVDLYLYTEHWSRGDADAIVSGIDSVETVAASVKHIVSGWVSDERARVACERGSCRGDRISPRTRA